jgi:hypothetical protein
MKAQGGNKGLAPLLLSPRREVVCGWLMPHPSLLYNVYRVFPGGKERLGRDTDLSPPSSAVVMKEYSYTYTPPMGRTACTEPQCLYKGALLHICTPKNAGYSVC